MYWGWVSRLVTANKYNLQALWSGHMLTTHLSTTESMYPVSRNVIMALFRSGVYGEFFLNANEYPMGLNESGKVRMSQGIFCFSISTMIES